MRFFSNRCFNLDAGDFSHRKHPPPGVGYFILYFSANAICSFLPRPLILRNFSLFTNPDFSTWGSFNFFAESGRGISKSSCSSIVFMAEGIWDIGLWPITSPVAMSSILCLSAYSLAFLNMKILQSLHGLMPAPVPCFGFFRMSRYSERSGSLLTSMISNLTFSF